MYIKTNTHALNNTHKTCQQQHTCTPKTQLFMFKLEKKGNITFQFQDLSETERPLIGCKFKFQIQNRPIDDNYFETGFQIKRMINSLHKFHKDKLCMQLDIVILKGR
jgi:hypothetical protein